MFVYKDFGGIRNAENKVIKENMLMRSINLNKLKKADIKKLKKSNLSKVIDLRTNIELKEKPDIKIENVKYMHVPIFEERTVGITHEEDNLIESLSKIPDMTNLYIKMVTEEYSVSQLKKVINEIVNSEDFSILFHCTAGKDRTGIVSMLVLNILDVNMDEIMKDYLYINKRNLLRTNICYCLIKIKTRNAELASRIKQVMIADENYLVAAIYAIEKKYGSVESFIRDELGITDETKEKFKSKILI